MESTKLIAKDGTPYEWLKLGGCNAMKIYYSDGSTLTFVPEPVLNPELVEEGIEYFKNIENGTVGN